MPDPNPYVAPESPLNPEQSDPKQSARSLLKLGVVVTGLGGLTFVACFIGLWITCEPNNPVGTLDNLAVIGALCAGFIAVPIGLVMACTAILRRRRSDQEG